tara:strand:+ start:1064 stop:1624 length:561 start_codon:yes stop_codon:yes gene_type:complete
MYVIRYYLNITFLFILPLFGFASEPDDSVNSTITNLLRPNWPYEAFLAIPRISDIRPTLALEFSGDDKSLIASDCVELYYLELKKEFEPKIILERESLHKLLCKAMKRAIQKTPILDITRNFPDTNNVALSFDFFGGVIRIIEMPYPPMDPILELENVFLDHDSVLSFGGIELPVELEPEINQTPL